MRRTAVATLTEHMPDGYAPALLSALSDADAGVRRASADAIRELVEARPIPTGAEPHLLSADMAVRAAAVYLLAARRAGNAGQFRRALGDPDHRVRIQAVRALVSVDDVDGVVTATGDENREVRIAAAAGLATLRGGAEAVSALIADPDLLVRAAALAALGELGCRQEDFATVEQALRAPAWQVRQGAARALAGAVAELAVPRLSEALSDAHLDVRKAAVLSLTGGPANPRPATRSVSRSKTATPTCAPMPAGPWRTRDSRAVDGIGGGEPFSFGEPRNGQRCMYFIVMAVTAISAAEFGAYRSIVLARVWHRSTYGRITV